MINELPVVRRVVTGHDENGRSTIESDGPPPGVLTVERRPGYRVANIWRTTSTPCVVHAADDISEHSGILPPKNGTILRVIDLPPEPSDPVELSEMLHATFRALYPDADHTRNTGVHQGMHRTLTVDYAIILAGSVTSVMDEGEIELSAGDILIQRGTNHAWANRSGQICRIAFILIDGR